MARPKRRGEKSGHNDVRVEAERRRAAAATLQVRRPDNKVSVLRPNQGQMNFDFNISTRDADYYKTRLEVMRRELSSESLYDGTGRLDETGQPIFRTVEVIGPRFGLFTIKLRTDPAQDPDMEILVKTDDLYVIGVHKIITDEYFIMRGTYTEEENPPPNVFVLKFLASYEGMSKASDSAKLPGLYDTFASHTSIRKAFKVFNKYTTAELYALRDSPEMKREYAYATSLIAHALLGIVYFFPEPLRFVVADEWVRTFYLEERKFEYSIVSGFKLWKKRSTTFFTWWYGLPLAMVDDPGANRVPSTAELHMVKEDVGN